jgi:hypothetical protein
MKFQKCLSILNILPNEVISFIDSYVERLDPNINILYIFCDNAFFQNKNRYNWLYFLSLIKNQKLDEIIVIYPIPGHSYLDCDRDFGRIEKNRLKIEKISFPSEYVKLMRDTDEKFNVNYVNFPLTDDLKHDGSNIITVKNFKDYFENFLANSVDQLTQIRKIKFNKNSVFATTNLFSEIFNINVNLLKPNLNIDKFELQNLRNVNEDFRPIKQSKFNDVKKLLKYVIIPPNVKFYESLTYSEEVVNISESKLRAHQILCEQNFSNCQCKGKCMRLCDCKKNAIFCNENCSCNHSICKNRE